MLNKKDLENIRLLIQEEMTPQFDKVNIRCDQLSNQIQQLADDVTEYIHCEVREINSQIDMCNEKIDDHDIRIIKLEKSFKI